MSIKNKLQSIIRNSVSTSIDIDKIVIDSPKDKKNGDYSTNIAFLLAKELKKSPMDIANDIKDNIKSDLIEKVEVASPGFINIYLSKEFLLSNINEILDSGKNYGKSDFGGNKKINIEYVSARRCIW